MVILEDYSFLWELVKEGQVDKTAPFDKTCLCLADRKEDPQHIFVFKFDDQVIWSLYGWTKVKNKSFLKFYKEIEKYIFKFNKPILRMGKNNDFKNHTRYVGLLDGHKVYQYVRSF